MVEREACGKYVGMIRESKESFITYKGILITKKLMDLVPKPAPACQTLVQAYISMDLLPAFYGFCKDVLPEHAKEC